MFHFMNLLFIGDIVSRPGRTTVRTLLPSLREEYSVDFVIANAENLSGGRGVSEETLDEMMQAGIDYFTSGDHIFWNDDFEKILNDEGMRVLRPANLPEDIPGRGYTVINTDDFSLGIINLVGHTTEQMDSLSTDPFRKVDQILEEIGTGFPVVIDFHGEYTSEKRALTQYVATRVSAVFGTHTHVGTIDTEIISESTGMVTDAGMVGAVDSVLGVEADIIIAKQKYPYPQRFEWVKSGRSRFNSVLATISDNGVCTKIERVDRINP